jgi:hypothetical protein
MSEEAPTPNGVRQDVFAVPEGEVSIRWPQPLSPESLGEVIDWLDLLKRQISRTVMPRQSYSRQPHPPRVVGGETRKATMHAWLQANGPGTRSDVIKGTGLPQGTVGSLLSQCPELFESRDGKWHAR